MRYLQVVLILYVGSNFVHVLLEVLGVGVGHVVGKVNTLALFLNSVDEGECVIDSFTTNAGQVKVFVLVRLGELDVRGDSRINMPPFLRLLIIVGVILIPYPRQHSTLV